MVEVSDTEVSNRKLAAGLLAIFLGGFGLHKFLLGRTRAGLIMLVATVAGGAITCGVASFVVWVIGIVEGMIYLNCSPEAFRASYLEGGREWF